MSDIEFRSDMRVEYVDHMGDDRRIAQAARVSVGNDRSDRPHEGLVRRLWADQHTSTFEHNVLTVMVDVPIFVAREWHRHRTFAYNEISARYSEVAPVFYVPGEDRPLVQTGKAMDYRREPGDDLQARAPKPREPWQDLADVIGEHTYEPDPKWLAQALYQSGVRVTGGGE